MIEKFFYFYSKAPNNAYSFYVHPLGNFGIGQGADGFAINTNHLEGIKNFWSGKTQKKLKLQRETINATYSWDLRSDEWKKFFDKIRKLKT